jgi:hypothetical protein
MTVVSFMTANFVARELAWRMNDWGEGDRATPAAFQPEATYRDRLASLLDEARGLGLAAASSARSGEAVEIASNPGPRDPMPWAVG